MTGKKSPPSPATLSAAASRFSDLETRVADLEARLARIEAAIAKSRK